MNIFTRNGHLRNPGSVNFGRINYKYETSLRRVLRPCFLANIWRRLYRLLVFQGLQVQEMAIDAHFEGIEL
jgi:hypothetical protein